MCDDTSELQTHCIEKRKNGKVVIIITNNRTLFLILYELIKKEIADKVFKFTPLNILDFVLMFSFINLYAV